MRQTIGLEDLEIRRGEQGDAVKFEELVGIGQNRIRSKRIDNDDGLFVAREPLPIEVKQSVGFTHFCRVIAAGGKIGWRRVDVRTVAIA